MKKNDLGVFFGGRGHFDMLTFSYFVGTNYSSSLVANPSDYQLLFNYGHVGIHVNSMSLFQPLF